MKQFAIIKRVYIWLALGSILLIGSWIAFFMGYRPSIEFTGGVEAQISPVADDQLVKEALDQALDTNGFPQADVATFTDDVATNILISVIMTTDNDVNTVQNTIKKTLVDGGYVATEENILGLSINGPTISSYMRTTAVRSLILGVILVVIYMFFSFGAIRKVIRPEILAVVTVATMLFDISIPAGAYGIAMLFNATLQVDSIFIIGLLTIMGYSINDTIVVLDRVRDNAKEHETGLEKGTMSYAEIFEISLRQTMRRSIGTSLSTFLVIVAMLIFGSADLQNFAFVMGVGIITGTYSSIFIAIPGIYLLLGKIKKEKKVLARM